MTTRRATGDAKMLLSEATRAKLIEMYKAPADAEFTYDRKSKYVVDIIVHVGLCQYGRAKFNVRNMTMRAA
jgi:hypothetical protein